MPAKYHAAVARSARRAGLRAGSARFKAYVYGTLAKIAKRHNAKRRKR